MLQRAASNAYSWWWASQIRTKQSKWLENCLQDMDEKIEVVLKLLQDDGDSFAKKADMYYRRRPELIVFVQETYKAYRGLAERYDHISGELHKANNTIATVFPDQHFGMDEDEDEVSPRGSPKVSAAEGNKLRKVTPPVPSTTMNKSTKPSTEKLKAKGKKKANPYANAKPENTQEQINKLQKEILVMQTEEYVKASYESGLAKFWEIENKITEMQDKVCRLQDECSEDAVIEDDEARALMAVAALKSCEDTLVSLQEKQKKSIEEARKEAERTKKAKEKLVALKKECGQPVTESGSSLEEEESLVSADSDMEKMMCILNKERLELQSMCEKVQKSFQTESEVIVVALAEKIDELASKVIALETTDSLQTAQTQRLREENNELLKNLQALEDEKTTMAGNPEKLSDKMRQVERELEIIQELGETVHDESKELQKSFSAICHTFSDLSNKLQSPENGSEEKSKSLADVQNLADRCIPVAAVVEEELKHSTPVAVDHEGAKSENVEEVPSSPPKKIPSSLVDEVPVCSTKRSVKFVDQTKEAVSTDNEQHAEKEVASVLQSIKEVAKNPETTTLNSKESEIVTGLEQKNGVDEALQEENTHESLESEECKNSHVFMNERMPEGPEEAKREEVSVMDTSHKCHSLQVSAKQPEEKDDCGDSLNWKELYMNGLENREKVLLAEYTNTLGNFKEVKKKLTDAEKKNQEYSSETRSQIRDLEHSIAMKDEEIRSLRQKLNIMEGGSTEVPKRNDGNSNSPRTQMLGDHNHDPAPGNEKIREAEESRPISMAEEKFRRDIDELLEENLEFWVRFSSSFQQIQRYQIVVQTVQAEVAKLKDVNKKQEGGSTNGGESSVKSEASLIYKQLSDLQTDMSIWVEQNGLLTEELHSRFSSLDNIIDEILRVSKEEPMEGEVHFTPYQAKKFQGEVVSMQQENNKVADELHAGLVHVRSLQNEIDKSMEKLDKKFGFGLSRHGGNHSKNHPGKNKVPLKSFLFGSKPKKQSIFACVNPAMQRPFSDQLQKPQR